MEQWITLVLVVMIGGLIGWLTNKIAIKMLFRPVNPINILGFKLQGVFPKRKDEMAVRLAETIETELLSKENLLDAMFEDETLELLKEKLMTMLLGAIKDRIPPMAKMFLGDNVEGTIKQYLDKHKDSFFNEMMTVIKEQGEDAIDIKGLVQERIDELDFIEFEKILFGLMKKELKHVEIIGLFLGGMIGFIQYLITYFL